MRRESLRHVGVFFGSVVIAVLAVLVTPRHWWLIPDDASSLAESAGEGARFACPMFCVILRDPPPEALCPVCGMELQEVQRSATLDRNEQAMVGLDAARVERRPLEREIQQIGEVDYDERRLSTVTTRIAGFLEKVHVRETWSQVQAGEPLVEIYSPELHAVQGDHLVAWRSAKALDDEASSRALSATRGRLRNLGLDDREIAALEERGQPLDRVPLRAPQGGVVIRRHVLEGDSVTAGQDLYVIAELDAVWILLEVFEHELPWVARGQAVELSTETAPGEVFEGVVEFIDPVVDRKRRTVRVRVAADNPEIEPGWRRFLPGQRVAARIQTRLSRRGGLVRPDDVDEDDRGLLAVPREAVLRTGDRDVVYVLFAPVTRTDGQVARSYDLDPNALPADVGAELVELRLGPLGRDARDPSRQEFFPVLGIVPGRELGLMRLQEGHLVIREGNFLVDSQAQLSGRPSLLFPDGLEDSSASDPHANH